MRTGIPILLGATLASLGHAGTLPDVQPIPDPPRGFDPLSASVADLQRYGFPAPPQRLRLSEAYDSWAQAMRHARTRLVPVLRATAIAHGPARSATPAGGNATSHNWSAVVLANSSNGFGYGAFFQAVSAFTIPRVQQPFGVCSGDWKTAAFWVGVDGWVSTDVMQAGAEGDAYCAYGSTTTDYYAWFEWYPLLMTVIQNMTVQPGDSMYVSVTATSGTTCTGFIQDETGGEYVALNFRAPAGTVLRGDSAEWVTERPSHDNGVLYQLDDYQNEYFTGAYSQVMGQGYDSPGSWSYTIGQALVSMLDDAGRVNSVPRLTGVNAVETSVAGSAY